uniref:Sister chromatid cohesion 1 protein 4 isoform X1 n=1 Tax=Rhizophora mucronata TaxID=61149 RepID=A0A2P2MQ66_RHIMU
MMVLELPSPQPSETSLAGVDSTSKLSGLSRSIWGTESNFSGADKLQITGLLSISNWPALVVGLSSCPSRFPPSA